MDRAIKKKKFPPKKIAGLTILSIFVFIILYTLIFGDKSSKLNVKKERITISEVTKGPFKEFIPVIGTVLPIETFYLDAEEGGRVEKKFIEAGTHIEKGQQILKLGNTNLLLNIMFREE